LFREAEQNDAVLFFDECESLFAARGHGGSAHATALLTVMERYAGLVFLATNRPFDLDEAMHRRIHYVFHFKLPNHAQRREIWRIHTTAGGLLGASATTTDGGEGKKNGGDGGDDDAERESKQDCDDDDEEDSAVLLDHTIRWEEIALRYELSGGFIRNAVLSALMMAVSRCDQGAADDGDRDEEGSGDGTEAASEATAMTTKTKKKRRKIPVITEADIHAGCAVQMRGALQMTQFDHRCVPTAGLPSLVLDDTTRQKVLDVVVSTPFVVVSSSLSSSMSVCHFISKTDDAPSLS
jgi:SpoVK/Ycf46/Vps4 family AAA+-type ATPase